MSTEQIASLPRMGDESKQAPDRDHKEVLGDSKEVLGGGKEALGDGKEAQEKRIYDEIP